MIDIADDDRATHRLLLEVTLEAKRLVTLIQQSLIDRAMRRMTDGATFTHRFVLVDKWTALSCVTLKASVVLAKERCPASMHMTLRHTRGAALHRIALVRFMAVDAAHLSFQDRVMMRQLKVSPNIQVTLQTGFRFFPGINDQVGCAATLRMKTARAMARFAAGVLGVCSCRLDPRMGGGAEIANDLLVAIGAFVSPNELRARHRRRSYDGAAVVECSAGEKSQGKEISATGRPKQSPAMSEKPLKQCAVPHPASVLKKNGKTDNDFS